MYFFEVGNEWGNLVNCLILMVYKNVGVILVVGEFIDVDCELLDVVRMVRGIRVGMVW